MHYSVHKIMIKLLKDECGLMTHTCHEYANCIDEDIGYRCECWEPFVDSNGDGLNCVDFDECTDRGFTRKIFLENYNSTAMNHNV